MPTSTSSTVAITLDLGCCRCRTKIQKILCRLQERCGFVFEKVVYEKDKALVYGPFDAVDLCCKLRCKAGCFATKIEIVPPEPPRQPEKKKNKEKVPPTPKPVVEEDPSKQPEINKQPEPAATCKPLIPYPYPCPYPYPYPCQPCPNPQPITCPSSCATPPRSCQCHSCRPPPPPCPAPPPPRPCPPPPVCKCPAWTLCQCRGNYPWVVCCEENNLPPDGPCAVM